MLYRVPDIGLLPEDPIFSSPMMLSRRFAWGQVPGGTNPKESRDPHGELGPRAASVQNASLR